jgi:hypothetical protein
MSNSLPVTKLYNHTPGAAPSLVSSPNLTVCCICYRGFNNIMLKLSVVTFLTAVGCSLLPGVYIS